MRVHSHHQPERLRAALLPGPSPTQLSHKGVLGGQRRTGEGAQLDPHPLVPLARKTAL